MQPLGRKKIRIPSGKHKVSENGKHLTCWWEVIASRSKRAEKNIAARDIKMELDGE